MSTATPYDGDHFGDLRPILDDDLDAFVREDDRDRSLTVVREIGDPDIEGQARRWVRNLRHADADIAACAAMQIIVDRHADGSREEQRAGIVAALRFDELGHVGLAAALDALWSVRAKDARDFWRMVESGRRVVLAKPSPAGEKGCSCPGTHEKIDRPAKVETPDPDRSGEGPAESGEDDDDGDSAEDYSARVFAREVAKRVRELRIADEAKRLYALERRADRPSIASGIISGADLDTIEPPLMLMGSLIPEDSIGFLSGRSGAYKSFLAVSWSCSIATGRAWLDDPAFAVRRPLKTLYIAAEGSRGAAARARAWRDAHGVKSLDGQWDLYPRPILLNDAGQAEELAEVVEAGGYGLLIVDTYRRSTAGSEENSSSDFAVVFEAVARLRDEHGCGVLFLDHTGHAGDGRPVGAEGKIASADYVLSTMYDGPTREPSVQRELFVIKLKDEESSGRWSIRLRTVEGHSMPTIEIGEVGALDGSAEILGEGKWWTDERPIPREVSQLSGRGAGMAMDVVRVLMFVGGAKGMTRAEITSSLRERTGKRIDTSQFSRALAKLDDAGLTEPGESGSRIVLARGLKRPDCPAAR